MYHAQLHASSQHTARATPSRLDIAILLKDFSIDLTMISIDLTMISDTTTVTQKTPQKTRAQRNPGTRPTKPEFRTN